MSFQEETRFDPFARDRDLVVHTERYMRTLEGFIRRRPEEWMWMYRMWRNHEKPSGGSFS